MNDEELNAIAQGMFLYLVEQTKDPIDALSVILCMILIFYEKARIPNADFPIEEFAEKFGIDMIHHWKNRTILTDKGPGKVQ